MRNIVRNLCLVAGLLLLALWSITPPSEKLRQGKDLRGGFSLIYQLQIDSSEDASEVMGRTITVLKDRVDPQGLLEISIVPQGRDRIEITMPLPSDEVKALRAEYTESLDDLAESEISTRDVERLVTMSRSERRAAIESLASRDESRREMLGEFVLAVETVEEVDDRFTTASDANAPAAALNEIEQELAAAQIALEIAEDAVVDSILRAEQVRNALQLSDEPRFFLDEDSDEPFTFPSARDRALDDLRAAYPGQVAVIDQIVDALETYEAERTTLDDPNDLIRLLQGSGVLEFRIAPRVGEHPEEQRLRDELRESGPRSAVAQDAGWHEISDPTTFASTIQEARRLLESPAAYFGQRGDGFVVEPYEGAEYMLLYSSRDKALLQDESRGRWQVAQASETVDETGRPAVGFRMDPNGAVLLGNLTEQNVRERMAVLLDDRVITAPVLNSKISSNGIIQGIDSPDERRNIIRTLNAGTLSASLTPQPISQSILGPELGQDNLDAGLKAGIIALVAVSIFMVFYYFTSGLIAVLALASNALIILAMLSLGRAALTLPGIAGIILTFGMAVDANVLIFERIREEMRRGVAIRPAVRLGFDKALSSIVDGNVTNLIVCLVLANIGTQEIKGFAITLGIGVVGTLFSALVVSRLIFALLVERVGIKSLGSLPRSVPALERALEPNLDWLRIRVPCIVISAAFISLGVAMIIRQGPVMLDNEFRGGTAVTLVFADSETGESKTLARPDVKDRIDAIAEAAPEASPLKNLASADILPVNPAADGITSSTFRIKTLENSPDAQTALSTAIQEAFKDVLPTKPPLSFVGDQATRALDAPLFPILGEATLGELISRPALRSDITEFDGGLAIVIEDLSPEPRLSDLQERLDYMRRDQQFSDFLGRPTELIIVDGDPQAVRSAALLVRDEGLTIYDSRDRWQDEVATVEWDLVREGLQRSESLAAVDSFDKSVAGSFRARAVAAVAISFLLITIYIWVRFGSVRYSLAAIVALVHDVMIAIGLIAVAEILYENDATASVARSLNVLPFKIDLSLVAALLTIIGYSLNDTIIIMDRIRENRGKLDYASRRTVNLSINQTVSRTVITSGTTLLAVLILYTTGGEGVRAFSYTLLIGVLVGTYSSVAVAAPLVWSGKRDPGEKPTGDAGPAPAGESGQPPAIGTA
ncbi:MAG: protein translocase subunit SecD [Planctomycetota bacterium]